MSEKVRVTIWRTPEASETKLESALHAIGIADHLEFVLGHETLPFMIRLYWYQRRPKSYSKRRVAIGDFVETRGWQRSEVFYNSYLTFDSQECAENFVQLLKENGALVQPNSMFTDCDLDGKNFNMLSVASRQRVTERRDYWRRCCDKQIDGWHDNSDARSQ